MSPPPSSVGCVVLWHACDEIWTGDRRPRDLSTVCARLDLGHCLCVNGNWHCVFALKGPPRLHHFSGGERTEEGGITISGADQIRAEQRRRRPNFGQRIGEQRVALTPSCLSTAPTSRRPHHWTMDMYIMDAFDNIEPSFNAVGATHL